MIEEVPGLSSALVDDMRGKSGRQLNGNMVIRNTRSEGSFTDDQRLYNEFTDTKLIP